jgi:hypothetical protein
MEVVAAILLVLLSISEALALNPKVKSNSLFQLIVGLLKKAHEGAEAKSEHKEEPKL